MDRRVLAELNERLFTHFVGGAWRAPMGDVQVPVARAGGGTLGRIVCAGPADVARARGLMRGIAAGAPVDAPALWAAMLAEAPLIGAMRTDEGFGGDGLRQAEAVALPRTGPLVLLSGAAVPVSRIVGLLIAGARDGMIWKPAPGAAASAHLIMRVLGPRTGGRLAMVQGDHETGALLAGQGALVWAGCGPVPDGLPRPTLDLAAGAVVRP